MCSGHWPPGQGIQWSTSFLLLSPLPTSHLTPSAVPGPPDSLKTNTAHHTCCSVFSYNVAIRRSAKAVGKPEARTLCARYSLRIIISEVGQRCQADCSGTAVADPWRSVCPSCPSRARQACTNSVTFPLLYFIPHYLNYHPQTGPTNEEGLGTTLVNIILNNNNYIIIYLSYNNM